MILNTSFIFDPNLVINPSMVWSLFQHNGASFYETNHKGRTLSLQTKVVEVSIEMI